MNHSMKLRARMVDERATILNRRVERISRWVSLAAKEVDFGFGAPPETYHSLMQADYVTVLARTPSGLFPVVKQFRPAVETYTWELPAGLMEGRESAEECCRRELLEEAGVHVQRIVNLGTYFPDTGRLGNCMHALYADVSEPEGLQVEEGLSVRFVGAAQLVEMVLSGEFRHQLHLGVLAAAQFHGVCRF